MADRLLVHTGNLHLWKEDGRFIDTTIKSGLTAFAPTWKMVMDWKDGSISNEDYIQLYLEQMRITYKAQGDVWKEVLGRDEVILGCYCPPGAHFCHRYLLAELLERLGAQVGAELLAGGETKPIPRLAHPYMKGA